MHERARWVGAAACRVKEDARLAGRPRPLHRRHRPARACCTRPCCAARTRMPASSRSTPRAARRATRRRRRAHRRGRRRRSGADPAAHPHHRGGARLLPRGGRRALRRRAGGRVAADRPRHSPRTRSSCIDVEYEPLPPWSIRDEAPRARRAAPLPGARHQRGLARHAHLRRRRRGACRGADGVLARALHASSATPRPRSRPSAPSPSYDAGTGRLRRSGPTISARASPSRSLAASLGVPQARVRLSLPDIGGGFGNKRRPAYLLICALLARAARAAGEVDRGPRARTSPRSCTPATAYGRGAGLPRRRHACWRSRCATSPTRARTSSPRPSTT